jgi:OFA family oxalate/formate antiporter-like MFS transporter
MANENSSSANRGWLVAFSGLGINLALGILYAWSLIKGKIGDTFGWEKERLNDPYALCCLVFAFAMILAGRCQDKFGPRLTASIGGVLVGAGLFLISTTNSYSTWLLGFGVLVGVGIGFGYSSATPPALKWFPPAKTGLVAGIVVAGFGLAPVYLAPLTDHLMKTGGVQHAMAFFSVLFTIVVVGLAQLLQNPPRGFTAATSNSSGKTTALAATSATPAQMLRSPMFYLLWVIYFIGSGAGLMVISSMSGMAKKSMGESAFIAVAVMAVGNAGGRITAGILSDKIGRRWTLLLVLLIQAALMFIAIPVTASKATAPLVIVLLATFIGFNYGANLCLFPSLTKDFWGLKSFGTNYGVLFTAWGVGGFVLSRLQQMLTVQGGGSFQLSFVTAGTLLLVGATLAVFIKTPRQEN